MIGTAAQRVIDPYPACAGSLLETEQRKVHEEEQVSSELCSLWGRELFSSQEKLTSSNDYCGLQGQLA